MAPLALTVSPTLMGPSATRVLCSRPSRPALRSRVPTLRTRALFGGGGGGDGQQGGGGNPFGNMANLMENLKKTQALVQQETAKVQEELAETEFEGFSEDETVRVVMTGNQVPVSVDVTQAAYDQGKEKLEALLLEASKEAHEKSVTGMKERMKVLAQTLGLPAQPGV
uniref:Nucleoid-associated protein n=1 Tax=Tetraselmis chuii TaxID=63592 RepID=A0A6U1H5K5_9CHLO|mmetsp:Transcript_27052/g.48197  ORF Transcript_27052/g.48197 Transcript_27052/m.48197 type:complete len:168 (+) Transcript_27052:114-617(+)|eukprot:CAMPEP_0177770596 /NCGR_PEP_ID=MMETSP0491_2-20121128/11033_1 /TAXON_ID=63592 /ORGANISM="Tetraselmis chuii, Strain PLY429" /LENGTH=167 /DNA_ID=CAMNT_0019287869 /DNA_START=145 /DNA_END=648 /DNA_ORIENTATION=-